MNEYRFVVREYTLHQNIGEKEHLIDCVGIGMYDSQKDIVLPLPLTDFIRQNYRRKASGSVSSQRNAAYEICKFLNYCMEMKSKGVPDFMSLRHKGIFGLKLIHGSLYISDLSIRSRKGELNGDYVYKIIRYLNKFYSWLHKQNLLEEKINIFYNVRKISNTYGGTTSESEIYVLGDIFDEGELGTVYPPKRTKKKNKLSDFGQNRYEIVKEFLEVASYVAPDIYLGIAFQFFGGLRRGEVVNLIKSSIIEKPEGMYLDVSDRQKLLFTDKKVTSNEQVKIPRYQSLFWNPLLEHALKKHLARLEVLKNTGELKNEQALFISSRTGMPISGNAYWYQFNKVKEEFLTRLSKQGRAKEYHLLANVDWSTHLARGVFTHFCIDAGMSISEIAIARGDANLNSILDYIEEITVTETMGEALNHLRNSMTQTQNNKLQSTISPKKQNEWRHAYEK